MTANELKQTIESAYEIFCESQERLPQNDREHVAIMASFSHVPQNKDEGDTLLMVAMHASAMFIANSIDSAIENILAENPQVAMALMAKRMGSKVNLSAKKNFPKGEEPSIAEVLSHIFG